MGQEMLKSGQQLERLIENFLIYARLELIASDPQKIPALRVGRVEQPAALVEKIARDQADIAGRGADLIVEAAAVAVPMSGEYFGKVVNELVQNAFKFSGAGTPVQVTLAGTADGVAFSVSDRGRGFSAEQSQRIGAYQQFDRKLQEQQGLGLGLVICKRLAELHGGTLAIGGSAIGGATVVITLPKPISG